MKVSSHDECLKIPDPPTRINVQNTDLLIFGCLEIRDQSTGEEITFVQEADAQVGMVRRYGIKDKNGAFYSLFQNQDGSPRVITEYRPIEIRWSRDGIREWKSFLTHGHPAFTPDEAYFLTNVVDRMEYQDQGEETLGYTVDIRHWRHKLCTSELKSLYLKMVQMRYSAVLAEYLEKQTNSDAE